MKQCARYALLISRSVDNDLNPTEQETVEAHCAACSECKQVYAGYRAIKNLVCESFAASILEIEDKKHTKLPEKKVLKFPVFNWPLRLAAMITIIALGVGIYSITGSRYPFPTVIENESYSMMNTPLGSLVYYEELAGKTVNSQFTKIKSNVQSSYMETSAALNRISEYKSPLFRDSSVLEQRYGAIKNSMIF